MNGTAQLGPKEKGLEARLAGDDTLGKPPPPGVGVTSEAAATAHAQAQQAQVLLVQAMERERQAIERERMAIQREREAIDSERKRVALAASSVSNTPPDQRGRLEDEKSEGEAIAKERRLLAEEREALNRQQREQERQRQQMDEDRIKIEREVQMMANLAAVETQVLKEALERMKLERGVVEKEREQLWSQVQQLTAAQEQLTAERDDLSAENERLEKSRDELLGIQRDRGAEGLQAKRDLVEAERRDREQADLQLARDTVERDKQEIEKIRVEIENIMKAWEIERDRQAKERQQIDAEKEELAAVRAEAERQWRQMTAGMPGMSGMPAGIPRLASILAQQSVTASTAGVSPITAMPVLPSFAAMAMNANGGLSLAPATSAAAGFLVDEKQPQLAFTPVHQPRGSSSLTTSPVSTPPQPSSAPVTSSSTGAKRKRKRGDSLNLSAGGSTPIHQESASEADFKKRRKVRPWEERFEELLQFKEKHGHFSVPAGGDYASLRIWVNNQKALHTKGQLAADRFEKLNVIGFPWWNPKGNRSGKGKKNEDGDESTALVDVKKEESAQPSGGGQAHEEDKAQRRKELEEFFGCSLEPYPALVHKFVAKNAERAIDNAIVWLTMPQHNDQHQGGEKSESDATKRSEREAESVKSEEAKAMAERREKVALLRRIEGIVGLGDDPLRELMEKGGFRVFSSDVSLRREDLDWLTHHYDEIKSAFLLSTFSKKVNKGDWNQKLLMNEVEKIYASFLGFDLQHRNLRTKFLSTLGKAVSEWSYYLPRDHFTLWSHAVCLRAKHLSLQQLSGSEGAQLLQFDQNRFLVDRRPSLGDVDSGRSDGPSPLVRLLNLPYLIDMDRGSPTTATTTTSATEPTASARRPSVDADPAQSTSSRASSPPSLSSSSSSSSLNNSTDEGVSSLLNSFNLPNFPSYVHKKPFQRRRGSSSVPGASLAALAYQHMQQTQQPQPPHVSEVIIEEVSSDDDAEHEMTESTTTTTTRTASPGRRHPHQQATVEEIEEEEDVDDNDDDVAPPHIVRPHSLDQTMDLEGIEGESGCEEEAERGGGPSAGRDGELMIDLNDGGYGEEDNHHHHHTATCPPRSPPRE